MTQKDTAAGMPDSVLNSFVRRSCAILKDELTGIYLHGSAVMGCFNPAKSDIDLIIVVGAPMSDPVKRRFMDMVAELNASAPAKGIEMSVVTRDVCAPFVYPTPFELHFSAGYLERYRSDPDEYIRNMRGTDKDLAAHFTVIGKRGRCLYGAPIKEVFAEVPRQAYMDSLMYDVENAEAEIADNAMYLTLNLARVLAYAEEGRVLSKKEGGEWAIGLVPEEYRPLVEDALNEYVQNAAVTYDAALAGRYAGYMLGRIEKSM